MFQTRLHKGNLRFFNEDDSVNVRRTVFLSVQNRTSTNKHYLFQYDGTLETISAAPPKRSDDNASSMSWTE